MRQRAPSFAIALAGAISIAGAAGAAEPAPLAGCYERVYDDAHLAQHKGQLVVRVALTVAAPSVEEKSDNGDRIVADGILKMWTRGRSKSFDSLGACRAAGKGLMCLGSLSAAEADTCKSKRDGVRDCRVDPAEAGSFTVEGRPDGVLVSIPTRLELVPAPYDVGPYLSLSAGNAENRAFLLKTIGCKYSARR